MELGVVILMLAAGGALAVVVMVAIGIVSREQEPATPVSGASERDRIAVSILFRIVKAGGVTDDEALRQIRRNTRLAASPALGIDLTNWAEAFARNATPEQRTALLETAVQLIATRDHAVPLRQYVALLDLSFALGFQTDALAKLRERYGFDYVDHAKDARPREADRAGGATPLFVRDTREPGELLRVLEIADPAPTRQAIISAYRRLAARHHPDKVFGQPAEIQTDAARRFIEITRAYESLLSIYRE